MQLSIVYEDNHIIAAVKPAGVLSQADKSSDESMLGEVKIYLKKKYQKPGNVFVGLLHRLDRPVSGIMLFAKTSKGASRLSEQFRNHTVQKTYHAIVTGKPPQQKGSLINKLGKDTKTLKGREFADGREAVLYYEVIAFNSKYSLLKVVIEGGQFHQIRAQLSLAGLPIVGDVKYGSKEVLADESIALCATGISFTTATTNEVVNLTLAIPETWKSYSQLSY